MDEERVEVLYHGTTLDVAQKILAEQRFDLRDTFFAETRELAQLFALRSRQRARTASRPAIIAVPVYLSDILDWKKGRLVHSKPFDDTDVPELRGKVQLKFTAGGMRFLNAHSFADEWKVIPLD